MLSKLPSKAGTVAAPAAIAVDGNIRSDADNLKLIEAKRASHDALRNERVRVDRDIETLEEKQAEAMAAAKARFGTDDIEELRQIVRDNYKKNTAAADAYIETIEQIESELAALQPPTP